MPASPRSREEARERPQTDYKVLSLQINQQTGALGVLCDGRNLKVGASFLPSADNEEISLGQFSCDENAMVLLRGFKSPGPKMP